MRPSSQRWIVAVVALVALAFAARLAYSLSLPPEIVVTFEADPITYDQIARNVAAGRGFSGASFYYPPGSDVPTAFWDALYPLFLAATYTVAGHNVAAVRIVQALLGGMAVWLTYWLGYRLAGPRAGIVAALISAVYPFFIYYSAQLLTETLFMLLILAVFAALLKAVEAPSIFWHSLLGALVGLAALCRAEAFYAGLALIAWAAWRTRIHLAAVGLLCVALVMAPWVIRNQLTFGAPILTTTKLGYNLYKYYHPTMTADQTVRSVPFPALDGLTEPEREKVMRKAGIGFMTADPARTAWFMLNKLALLFKLSPSNEVNQRYAAFSLLSYGALLPFMAGGLVLAIRRGGDWLPLVGYVLFSISTKAAVFAGIRLRMQIEPFLILLAALALSTIAQRLRPAR